MKVDADENGLLESVERGEWKSVRSGKRKRTRYSRYARATFRRDRRLNIRLSSKDPEAIQKRALAEGLLYQTLISSLLHKYASGAQGSLTAVLWLPCLAELHQMARGIGLASRNSPLTSCRRSRADPSASHP